MHWYESKVWKRTCFPGSELSYFLLIPSQIPLSCTHLLCWIDSTFWIFLGLCVEKAMATYSSTLAWKVPRMEEPGRLQSMESLRVRHYWATSLSLFTFLHWRRKWQPTPVFLPGESQGWQSLVDCHLWGRTESDTTEDTYHQQQQIYSIIIYFLLSAFSSFVWFLRVVSGFSHAGMTSRFLLIRE